MDMIHRDQSLVAKTSIIDKVVYDNERAIDITLQN